MNVKAGVGAAVTVAALLAVMAPGSGCSTTTTGVSVSGGGAAVLVAHPWARGHGVWVREQGGWGWLAAGAAAGALGALILAVPHNPEGSLGKASKTGYGSKGYVPYGKTTQCRNSGNNNVVERWVSIDQKMFLKCSLIREIWKSGRRIRGKDILACITWILARGGTWNGGKVVADSFGEIISVTPANGDWAKCAKG